MSKEKKNNFIKFFVNLKNFIMDMDKTSLVITIILFTLSVLWISSASAREAVDGLDQDITYYTIRQLEILALCLVASICIYKIPMKGEKFLWWLWTAGYIAMVIACIILIFSNAKNRGASNWLPLFGGFHLQPGEVIKACGIVLLSFSFESFIKKLRSKKDKHWLPIIVILGLGILPFILAFLQKDLGTGLIYLFIFAILFFSSPIVKMDKLKITGIGGICVVLILFCCLLVGKNPLSEEQQSRLTNFTDPCNIEKRNNDGYQVCNAYIAINLGGFNGVGVGKSTQKYSYIPEPHTDMIFSIITEENGFIAGAIVIILYMILIIRLMVLSSSASSLCGKYICLGTSSLIFAHIMVNLGGILGILPLTGVPLSFLSYGGSFTITLSVLLALCQRIHVETKRSLKKNRGAL